jgi:hypothetical protein
MKNQCMFTCLPIALSLALVAVTVHAEQEFTYTDDWAVVSAPPPPGPYRAVNIDPRVPGVDAIPPLTIEPAPAPAENRIPAEAMTNAPAAGIPVTPQATESPASELGTQQAPTIQTGKPVRPQRVAPSPPGYYYPAPSRYPAQSYSVPPSAYPGYRDQPAYGGYYGSPAYRQGEQQVPPPPVYDSMMRNQFPAGKGAP